MIAIAIVAIVFSNLAKKYKKTTWGYAVLGVVTYFGTTFIYGIIYALIWMINNPNISETEIDSNLILKLSSVGVGVLVSYLLYFFLERNWKKQQEGEKLDINDIGKKLE
jgi:hypothetical protein